MATLPPTTFKLPIQHSSSSSPPSHLKCSSARVIWMCSTNFCNSSLGNQAWSMTSIPSLPVACQFSHACSDYWWSFHCPFVVAILVFHHPGHQSPLSISNVDLICICRVYGTTCCISAPVTVDSSFTLASNGDRVCPDLKTTLTPNFLQTHLMSSLFPATYGWPSLRVYLPPWIQLLGSLIGWKKHRTKLVAMIQWLRWVLAMQFCHPMSVLVMEVSLIVGLLYLATVTSVKKWLAHLQVKGKSSLPKNSVLKQLT